MREINALGETLATRRREATEALALLRAIMAEIDVAVFTFDDARHLRLLNRTAASLLRGNDISLVGRSADELGLAGCLDGDSHRLLTADFPGKPGARWSLHRSSFREAGRPHQLLVLADVSAPLREEERAAWQRLIRVLGHEINNSLTPIGSIAGSIGAILERPEPERAGDWQDDVREGLGIIGARAESLGRFMAAYSRLARLPAPTRRQQTLAPLIRAGGGTGDAFGARNARSGGHRGKCRRRSDRASVDQPDSQRRGRSDRNRRRRTRDVVGGRQYDRDCDR